MESITNYHIAWSIFLTLTGLLSYFASIKKEGPESFPLFFIGYGLLLSNCFLFKTSLEQVLPGYPNNLSGIGVLYINTIIFG
jgi:hypothetical protein